VQLTPKKEPNGIQTKRIRKSSTGYQSQSLYAKTNVTFQIQSKVIDWNLFKNHAQHSVNYLQNQTNCETAIKILTQKNHYE